MKKYILMSLILFFIASSAQSSQITPLIKAGISYPITQTIIYLKTVKNKRYISWKQANYQANIIYKLSEKYNIDWKLIVSMTFIESSFNQFLGPVLEWGPMQVSPSIWKKYCKYLSKTIGGGYECGIRYLKVISIRHKMFRTDWYSYYHSYTPKYRLRYKSKVILQLNKIDNFLDMRIKGALLHL